VRGISEGVVAVRPQAAAGVLFYSKLGNGLYHSKLFLDIRIAPLFDFAMSFTGKNDPRSMHAGCPPTTEGVTKFGGNVFMWSHKQSIPYYYYPGQFM
jgi:hypothetical protein